MEAYRIEGKTVKEHLLMLAERGNKTFSASLHPGVEHVLGIRLPDLRSLAKRIVKTDWESYLQQPGSYFMEERMLHGMVLGSIPPDADCSRYLGRVTRFVEQINSWSVCDAFSFAGGKNYVKAHADQFWEYLKAWMKDTRPYPVRFGVVMGFKYFLDDSHLHELLACFDAIAMEDYYVRMAVAWAVAECFIHFPDETEAYLKSCSLDDWTYRKSLQKMSESYRISADVKKQIRLWKRT